MSEIDREEKEKATYLLMVCCTDDHDFDEAFKYAKACGQIHKKDPDFKRLPLFKTYLTCRVIFYKVGSEQIGSEQKSLEWIEKKLEAQVEDLESFEGTDGIRHHVLLLLSSVKRKLGKVDEVETYCQRCLRFDPHSFEAKNNLATIYFQRGHYREAAQLLEESVSSGHEEVYENLVMCYRALLLQASLKGDMQSLLSSFNRYQRLLGREVIVLEDEPREELLEGGGAAAEVEEEEVFPAEQLGMDLSRSQERSEEDEPGEASSQESFDEVGAAVEVQETEDEGRPFVKAYRQPKRRAKLPRESERGRAKLRRIQKMVEAAAEEKPLTMFTEKQLRKIPCELLRELRRSHGSIEMSEIEVFFESHQGRIERDISSNKVKFTIKSPFTGEEMHGFYDAIHGSQNEIDLSDHYRTNSIRRLLERAGYC